LIDLLLYRTALRDLIRPRRLLAALPLVVMPAALALLWKTLDRRDRFEPETVYNSVSGLLVFGFILVILAVLFGTGVVSQEMEQRTILYLLSRPVARVRILLAKFAGAWTGITVTAWLAALLLAETVFGPAGLAHPAFTRDLLVLPVGALAYGAFFLLLATAVNRPLIFGLSFAFGWESWAPNLPGMFQRLSIMTYLRVLAPHPRPDEQEGGRRIEDLFAVLNPDVISPTHARWVLLGTIVVTVALAVLVFSLREYAPRDDAG